MKITGRQLNKSVVTDMLKLSRMGFSGWGKYVVHLREQSPEKGSIELFNFDQARLCTLIVDHLNIIAVLNVVA